MMYDGIDHPNNSKGGNNKSCSTSRLHPYQRVEVWEENIEQIAKSAQNLNINVKHFYTKNPKTCNV